MNSCFEIRFFTSRGFDFLGNQLWSPDGTFVATLRSTAEYLWKNEKVFNRKNQVKSHVPKI